MATKLSDAIIRITLDRAAAQASVSELEKLYDLAAKAKKQEAEDEARRKKEEDKKEKAKESGRKPFSLPPFTAAEFAGAIPVVGGAAKLAINMTQRFGPLAAGIMSAVSEDPDMPSSVKKAIGSVAAQIVDDIGAEIDLIDARLRAISATFEQVKQVAKAQLLLSGKLDTSDVLGFVSDEFTIQSTMLRFQKAQEDAVMRELGRGGQKAMIDVMRKAFKTN